MKKVFIFLSILLSASAISLAQNALNFDGINDYVQTNYTGITGTANRTFEAWIFISSGSSTSNQCILDYGINAVGSRNTFSANSGGNLQFISGGTNTNISTGINAVPINQWTHVAFVLNNGTGYLYVNGTQAGTGSLSGVNTPTTGQNVRVGERVLGSSIPFNGSIDEVRVWDVARTPAQIQASMNNELCSTNPNLKLYLQLNEGMAGGNNIGMTTAFDNSGNGYNGALNNFALTGTTSNWVNGSGIGAGITNTNLQKTACDTFLYLATSTVYTTSGIYVDTFMNASNCDSIVTLDLTINSSTTGTDVQTACNTYTWIDGMTYTANNNSATHTIQNAAGCDSLVTLNLTIGTINTGVLQAGATLTSNEVGASYQWVECPNYTPISGANGQSYSASADGSYAVVVSNSSCTDTSNCFAVSFVGIIENELGEALHVYPNPTLGNFEINLGKIQKNTTIKIMDLNGKLIMDKKYANSQNINIDLEAPTGTYFLFIRAEDKQAVVRLVKQ